MDIIDIMLARAMTPQGKTEAYVAKANAAAAKAEKAEQDAAEAIATVEAAADEVAAAQSEAADLLAYAREALETAQAAQINTLDTEDVDAEVKKLTVNTNTVTSQNANTYQIVTTYPDNTLNTQNITKLYKSTGNNEDGGMTQKAITDALNAKADKTYVDQQIAAIPAGTGSGSITVNTNLGAENDGKIVIVGEDGNITSSIISEDDIEALLLQSDTYVANDILGLTSDFENKSFERIQAATNRNMGADFNAYPMYGGRMRCNVSDNGEITAFYGDANYTEDGSNGQVMLYQPKFYYQRTPIRTQNNISGKIIQKETLLISANPHSGFKLHPLFKSPDGSPLEYVLLPVFDGSAYDTSASEYSIDDNLTIDFDNDKLSSVAGVKPISGAKHSFTIAQAEKLAKNRGNGWHITNMAAESANQMLEIIEFGMFNGQVALENGITNLSSTASNVCGAATTGSTNSLGNTTGYALSTAVEVNGTVTNNTTTGKRSISYRGMENPWGNIWRFIGGVIVSGHLSDGGGIPYICEDFSYTPDSIGSNYHSTEFSLPSKQSWISAMGYGNPEYDWVYMPADCSDNANSASPIGDMIWTVTNLNGNCIAAISGMWTSGTNCGPFYYGCDRTASAASYNSYSARLMYIPTKNATYTANYQAWLARFGA